MTWLWVLAGATIAVAAAYWLLMSPFSQLLGAYPYRAKAATEPVVALTFDDGPNEPYTSQIADYLTSKGIRGTFFQVGECVNRYPETTRRLHLAGHVIGNHSLSHKFHAYLQPGRLGREIRQTQAILSERIGRTPALFRSPWLWRQPWLLRTVRRSRLQPVSGEFCHPLEVLQIPAGRIARATVAKVKPGSIIIFHDGFDARGGPRAETVAAVKLTTEALLAHGYRFVTVDELLAVPAYLSAPTGA